MTGSNHDLRNLMNSSEVEDAFSKLVSGGKAGYKTIIEKNKKVNICDKCGQYLQGDEKFCPECGNKLGE